MTIERCTLSVLSGTGAVLYDLRMSMSESLQEPLSRTVSTSARLAALELVNIDMKEQIASLNARLAQHAQHAEQLLAGTEVFFGDKAGTIIGQPLEEEDSDSNMSFTSAQERSFSRPMSAASSYDSAHSRDLSSSSRYAATWLIKHCQVCLLSTVICVQYASLCQL